MNAVLCILSELLVRRRQIRGRRWIWSSSFNSCRKVRHRELKWFTREYQWQSLKIENQFSSITQSCPTLCDPMDCSTPGFPVHQQLPELTQSPVHQVSDAIQPSHPLLSPSPPTFNLSQHQGLFQWVSNLHQVNKALEFQLQHLSFQWIFRTDFL